MLNLHTVSRKLYDHDSKGCNCCRTFTLLQFHVQFTHRDFDDSSFNQNVLVLRCKNTLAYQFLRHGNSFVVRHTQVGQVVKKPVSNTRQDFSCVILEA